MAAGGSRHLEVRPASARAELGDVVRFSMVILIGVWMYLGTDGGGSAGTAAGTRDLLPFQALIQDRPAVEQRTFRELQEGLLEAEIRRNDRGAWPAVASLAADGIPPFTFDPTMKDARYAWQLVTGGTFVNYLGLPDRPGAAAWLVLIQEPAAGTPADPARPDEEHHRLLTGEMLHVSIWTSASRAIERRLIPAPEREGWTQLYAVAPARVEPVPPGPR